MNEMFKPLTPAEIAKAPKPKASDQKVPIIPVPDDAPPMRFRHPKHGAPVATWCYRDAANRVVGYVARFATMREDGTPDKEILPITYCELKDGKRAWRSAGVPAPRPLYNLPQIIERAAAPILICEGEKAADAAAKLFPDGVATTPMHGAKSPQLTAFAPCAGRTVIIATDHDQPGQEFGDHVAEMAREAGATRVLWLNPARLGASLWRDGDKVARDGEVPEGYDLADAIEDGWTAAAVATLADLFVPYTPLVPAADTEAADTAPAADTKPADDKAAQPRFRVTDRGVEKRIEGEDGEAAWRWICSPLTVTATTSDDENVNHGRLLEITTFNRRVNSWAMPMAMLAGDGTCYREELLSRGMIIAPGRGANAALHEYLSTTRPRRHVTCVGRVGWHGGAYVCADRAITGGEADDANLVLQAAGGADTVMRTGGTFEAWRDGVARYAIGNSRLALALSAAFAGPLLFPAGAEGGGFHFRGASSTGKTTALRVAGSAWGGGGVRGFVRTWRGTANGLESIAAAHCDGLLCLDEIGQVDGRDAGAIAYMLAHGVGKMRASRSGATRPPAEWRVLFLSSGELSLEDKIAEAGHGRRAFVGQQVRVIDIPIDAGLGFGMFEELHGFASPEVLAQALNAAAAVNYGHAAPMLIKTLAKNFGAIAPRVDEIAAEFVRSHCPAGADGQVLRVARRFALVAAAGEIATRCEVLPWPKGEALDAAAKCFKAWLDARGGAGAGEDIEAIRTVRAFIGQHGNSRFEAIEGLAATDQYGVPIEQRVINRVGFRRREKIGGKDTGGTEYLILPELWRSEVCAGLDPTAAARALVAAGHMRRAGDGKITHKDRIPGFPHPVRVYIVGSTILGDAEPPPAAELL